jgi:hypothetical protein
MRKVMLAAEVVVLSTIAASAQSSGPGLGTWGSGGGMSSANFQYWYGKTAQQGVHDSCMSTYHNIAKCARECEGHYNWSAPPS